MEIESTVNAEPVEVVTPQETGTPTEVVESETSEVTTEQPTEKVAQSPEENAKFAEFRRKAESEKAQAVQKARDEVIAKQYGESHGIYTEADFDKAVREQQQASEKELVKAGEIDPDDYYESRKKNDPDFKTYSELSTKLSIQNQITELNTELKDVGLDVTINGIDDLSKLPNVDAIIKHIEKGKTLSEAYFLANKRDLINSKAEKIQQDTIKKLRANGEASTGSLSNNGQTTALYTREQVDAMSQAEVNKNYDLVMKSMKTWK